MKRLAVYLSLLLFFVISGTNATAQVRVVGYLPTWGNFTGNVNSLDFTKYTHVNISFGNPSGGDISTGLTPNTLDYGVTQIHAGGAKALLSLGGAGSSTYYTTILNGGNREVFIDTIVAFLTRHNLDGVDLDLEGSDFPANYGLFVQELADTLQGEGKLVTSAVATWFSDQVPDIALAAFDFINIMSYDATGPWNPGNPGQHSPFSMAENDLAHWMGRGVPANKCVVGVPFYGYNFASGGTYMRYEDIISANPGSEKFDQIGQLYYNGALTMRKKTAMALANASGVMIWEITQDTEDSATSLLQVIWNEINGVYGANALPDVSLVSPQDDDYVLLGGDFALEATATDSDGSIDSVGFYANSIRIGVDYTAPYTFDWIGPAQGTYAVTAVAYDNGGDCNVSVSATVQVRVPQSPFSGIQNLPGTIQAESFDNGGNGEAYYDSDASNNGGAYRPEGVDIEVCTDNGGGYNVGWMETGEWLEYAVTVTRSDVFDLAFRVASEPGGAVLRMELDGANISGPVSVPATGGWQVWQQARVEDVNLTAGNYTLRIYVQTGGVNLNHFSVLEDGVLGLDEEELPAPAIYPNPVVGNLHLDFSSTGWAPDAIYVTNVTGEVILQQTGTVEQQLDFSPFAKGVYFIHCSYGRQNNVYKVIK